MLLGDDTFIPYVFFTCGGRLAFAASPYIGYQEYLDFSALNSLYLPSTREPHFVLEKNSHTT